MFYNNYLIYDFEKQFKYISFTNIITKETNIMVKICSLIKYPQENENLCNEHFEKFSYPLHTFQKWAIEGIVEGCSVLVTAPTGSGKSLPAEFAIDYFYNKGKKSIYCSPIKSLSNQKFYDFSQKYPHIRFGIITGDIRCNPDADVLIMTTEILLNKLYQISSNQPKMNSSISFEMNIEEELGCVIFDEIHMINDESRGHVWENSIMMLPHHIQMIGLSATLDNPEKFAEWFENRGTTKKEKTDHFVYLTSKKKRTVPLTHFSFITVNQGIFKIVKDKSLQEEIKKIINKPVVIQNSENVFQEENYCKMNKMLKLFDLHNSRVKKSHALNQLTKYLTEQEMTPAICYVFSIRNLEIAASEVTTDLLEFDSKIPYIVARECDALLRSKLPNFEEYLHLPEYTRLVSLLQKGIATHHSKMLPVLREIVEILFAKGYIKLLFATESVAIGLNLPVKSCIFTDIYKHDGITLRVLHGHEYTQAAGRAGRLGLDTVGNVFHLNNLFRNIDSVSYKKMMKGAPQTLVSKFKISYNLILNLLDIGNTDFVSFSEKSMITCDLENQIMELLNKKKVLQDELDKSKYCIQALRTSVDTIVEYIELQKKREISVNKKRKEIERKIDQIRIENKFIEQDITIYQKLSVKELQIGELQEKIDKTQSYMQKSVSDVVDLLIEEGFVVKDIESNVYSLTIQGEIAAQLRECHSLIFAKLIENRMFDDLTSSQLASLFSCFTNVSIQEEFKDLTPQSSDLIVQKALIQIENLYSEYISKETLKNINTGIDYTMHFDLLNYVSEWTNCSDVESCKRLLQKIGEEKEIFLGEFVKALLKINNISCELEKICEKTGNIELLGKLREIPNITLKYVVTNQSLYI